MISRANKDTLGNAAMGPYMNGLKIQDKNLFSKPGKITE